MKHNNQKRREEGERGVRGERTEKGREGCERSERREERRKIGSLERKGEERVGEKDRRERGWRGG